MGVISTIVFIKNCILLALFIIGCLSLVTIQFIFLNLFKNYPIVKQHGLNLTKTYFVQLMTFYHSNACPTKMSVTFDPKQLPKGSDFKVENGHLKGNLLPNSIIISNHQIYTDWLYHWFLLYESKLSSTIHIILKDLSNVPVLGYGMKNYNFMFLSRKWEKDKIHLTNKILELDANARGSGPANGLSYSQSANITTGIGSDNVKIWPDQKISTHEFPYTVVLYPEGTVPSLRTIKKSKEYCEKVGRPIMKHVLLPRTRGLYLLLLNLRKSNTVVYDITTGYSGLKNGDLGEDIYTLKNVFLKGKGPEFVSYHISSINLNEIPLGNDVLDIDLVKPEDLQKFEDWLFKTWYKKDKLMDNFYKYGSFIPPNDETNGSYKTVVGEMKLHNIFELTPTFGVAFLGILFIVRIFQFVLGKIF